MVRAIELTSLADGPTQYLLGALVLKLETSCCTRVLPVLGRCGGDGGQRGPQDGAEPLHQVVSVVAPKDDLARHTRATYDEERRCEMAT